MPPGMLSHLVVSRSGLFQLKSIDIELLLPKLRCFSDYDNDWIRCLAYG
jgi:hypothetical protein